MPVHSALFPIPLPLDDAWSGVPSRLGVQRRRRLALRRLVRLVIVALNYLHARAPFSVVPLLWRRPCSLHLRVYDRVAALCRAGGPPEMISIFGCGRKSFQLDARFRELLGAVQSLGIGGSMYHSGGAGKPVSIVNDKDQLIPYRRRLSVLEIGTVGLFLTSCSTCPLLSLPSTPMMSNAPRGLPLTYLAVILLRPWHYVECGMPRIF